MKVELAVEVITASLGLSLDKVREAVENKEQRGEITLTDDQNKVHTVKSVLEFMQKNDRNGTWVEWFEEIGRGESEFDKEYVAQTLQSWHSNSGDSIYSEMIPVVNSL